MKSVAVAIAYRLATLKGLLNSSLAVTCVCLFAVQVFYGVFVSSGTNDSMCIPNRTIAVSFEPPKLPKLKKNTLSSATTR